MIRQDVLVEQITSPSMEHAHHPDLAANEARVGGQFQQGIGRGAKQDAVNGFLVRTSQPAELFWESKGHHEVGDRQEQPLLLSEPLVCLAILANFCGGTCLLQRADDAANDPQILPPRPRPAEPAGTRDQKVWPVSESLRQNTEGQPDDRGFRRRYQD
jgi:hypothetical protein